MVAGFRRSLMLFRMQVPEHMLRLLGCFESQPCANRHAWKWGKENSARVSAAVIYVSHVKMQSSSRYI